MTKPVSTRLLLSFGLLCASFVVAGTAEAQTGAPSTPATPPTTSPPTLAAPAGRNAETPPGGIPRGVVTPPHSVDPGMVTAPPGNIAPTMPVVPPPATAR